MLAEVKVDSVVFRNGECVGFKFSKLKKVSLEILCNAIGKLPVPREKLQNGITVGCCKMVIFAERTDLRPPKHCVCSSQDSML